MTGLTSAPATPSADRRSALVAAMLAIYLVLLVWTILFKLEPPHLGDGHERVVKLVPFVRTADAGASAPVEVALNLVLFLPFGFLLGLLTRSRSWLAPVAAIAGTSLALEVAQYVFAVGATDVTDVIVNTAGGVLGLGLAVLARRRLRPTTVTRIGAAVTVLAVLATVAFLASPIHLARPGHLPPRGELPARTGDAP